MRSANAPRARVPQTRHSSSDVLARPVGAVQSRARKLRRQRSAVHCGPAKIVRGDAAATVMGCGTTGWVRAVRSIRAPADRIDCLENARESRSAGLCVMSSRRKVRPIRDRLVNARRQRHGGERAGRGGTVANDSLPWRSTRRPPPHVPSLKSGSSRPGASNAVGGIVLLGLMQRPRRDRPWRYRLRARPVGSSYEGRRSQAHAREDCLFGQDRKNLSRRLVENIGTDGMSAADRRP